MHCSRYHGQIHKLHNLLLHTIHNLQKYDRLVIALLFNNFAVCVSVFYMLHAQQMQYSEVYGVKLTYMSKDDLQKHLYQQALRVHSTHAKHGSSNDDSDDNDDGGIADSVTIEADALRFNIMQYSQSY